MAAETGVRAGQAGGGRGAAPSVRDYFQARLAAYVSPMGVKAWMDAGREDFIVVDVRLPGPQRNSLIPGAVWIPQSQVGARMAELPRERLLVLYCWDTWCSLAASAAVELLDAGFQVRELHGGVRAWRTLKLPEDSLA